MTELAKKLNIALEPFCVFTKEFTTQEAQDLLDRCVDLGATPYEGVEETVQKYYYSEGGYDKDNFIFIGITVSLRTLVEDDLCSFKLENISRGEVLEYLQLVEDGGRLVGKESVKDSGDFPSSADTVFSMTREDEDRFIPWNGGEMPVEKGTMVHVKYRNGEESICTAGVYSSAEGFERFMGISTATDWSHDDCAADIIAYKIYSEQPVASQDTISEGSSANVPGEGETSSEEPYLTLQELEDVFAGSQNQDTYNFFKDIQAAIDSKYPKIKLDKEIKEAEDKLKRLKEERQSYDRV